MSRFRVELACAGKREPRIAVASSLRAPPLCARDRRAVRATPGPTTRKASLPENDVCAHGLGNGTAGAASIAITASAIDAAKITAGYNRATQAMCGPMIRRRSVRCSGAATRT
jgi:hypothetical protein